MAMSQQSKIPSYASNYKREYLFVRGLNKYFKSFSKKLDLLNHGLFENNFSNAIKKYMKRFLRAQEKGKFNNLNNLFIKNDDYDDDYDDIILDIINIKYLFEVFKRRYDFFCENGDDGYDNVDGEYFVDGKPYPGFEEFYVIFEKIFNQINYKIYDSDSDSDSDIGIVYDSDSDIVISMVYDSDSDIVTSMVYDSDSDSDF